MIKKNAEITEYQKKIQEKITESKNIILKEQREFLQSFKALKRKKTDWEALKALWQTNQGLIGQNIQSNQENFQNLIEIFQKKIDFACQELVYFEKKIDFLQEIKKKDGKQIWIEIACDSITKTGLETHYFIAEMAQTMDRFKQQKEKYCDVILNRSFFSSEEIFFENQQVIDAIIALQINTDKNVADFLNDSRIFHEIIVAQQNQINKLKHALLSQA